MQVSLSSTQGTPADVLYKGTITRLITEDNTSRAERERDEAPPKGLVVYEGISGHIITYDRKYISLTAISFTHWPTVTFILRISSTSGMVSVELNSFLHLESCIQII